MTVRWGLLSTAAINDRTIEAAKTSERADIVAVAGRELERTRAYAREHGIERAYGSYDELLADPGVDAVYVSLPNSLHVEWSIRALNAGKHVLCEKPFSASAAEATAAFDVADANGVLMMEAFMYRHHPQTSTWSKLLADGAVGEPRLVRVVAAFNAMRIFAGAPNIRFDAALGGGALLDVGAYCVSGLRLVGGEPVRVFGSHRLGSIGVDLAFAGILDFGSGPLATFECGFDVEGRAGLEVLGTEGALLVPEPFRIMSPGVTLTAPGGSRHLECEAADPYLRQLENMCAAIEGEAEPLLGRADAVAQARVLEALIESARTGAAVSLERPSAAPE